jgi:VIT1/CCC1 family predicted Fe2+/Mn2+ transporter
MAADGEPTRQPILSPLDRYSEILFGLIMALGSTGTLSVAQAGHTEVRTMLYAALGCNTAWGLVDGIMYLFSNLSERGQTLALLRRLRSVRRPEAADRAIRESLPEGLREVLQPGDVDVLRQRLLAIPAEHQRLRLTGSDLRGAVGVALLVIGSTLPVALPFVFIDDPARALRASSAVANLLLFVMGWQLGRYIGVRPITMASAMVGIGLVCVGLTVALGG